MMKSGLVVRQGGIGRAESGDWRFLTVDWPTEWDTRGDSHSRCGLG